MKICQICNKPIVDPRLAKSSRFCSCESQKEKPLVLNEDYYLNEKGLMVFTEKYHLKRGYCCNNACKHCPYRIKL